MEHFVVSPGAERVIARFLSIVSRSGISTCACVEIASTSLPRALTEKCERRLARLHFKSEVGDSEERQETPRQQDQQMISHVSTTYKLVKKNTS